jgi:hypothetical protein
MRCGSALRRALMAGLVALLAFAPGVSLPGTAKLGLGGPAKAQDVFAIDQFYDALAPYGEWVYQPPYGYVWLPLSVSENWRPFTVGHWIYTDEYGWYWDSPEPFAWAVYHYGRWGFDPAYGWYWVPGDTWAPAWVQWRYGTDYVGWAPMEPDSYRGYAYGGPAAYAPPPPLQSWVFVRPRYLTAPVIERYVLPLGDVSIAFNLAPNVYRPEFRDGYVYNYGMPRDRWSRITHQHIQPRRIYRGNERAYPRDWYGGRHDRDLYVYAPSVKKGAHPRNPPKKVSQRPSKAKNQGKPAWSTNNGNAAQHRAPPWTRGAAVGTPGAHGGPAAVNPNPRGPWPGAVEPGARYHPQDRGSWAGKPPPGKSKAAKNKANKAKAAKAKPANANAAKAANARAAKARADKAKAAKAQANKAKAAKAKPANANAAKTANAKAAKARADRAKAARAKALAPQAKTANTKPVGGGPDGGNGQHGGKGGGDGKYGGGNRAAACKAKPDLPFCQKRGG